MSIKSSQTLVLEVLKEVKTISSEQALKLSRENKCDLIDIRELQKEEKVENSKHMLRGMPEFWLGPNSPYSKKI